MSNWIRAGEVALPAPDFDATLAFFTGQLGFRVASIFPADAPQAAVLVGHGLRLRLDAQAKGDPGTLHLLCENPALVSAALPARAPNGTRILFREADPPLLLPPTIPSLVVTRAGGEASWHAGRAGLRYRDLIPGRWGGAFIASHIRIPEGGPVPDYVHFHKARFQMIYCRRGWVRVVYEDQGEPFVMAEGDCVLQPPRIRHRVLESSPGLEVVEVACPALHETCADLEMELPNGKVDPLRDYSGQRFVRHIAANAPWKVAGSEGFEARDLGLGEATRGLGGARVLRTLHGASTPTQRASGEFHFLYVLSGQAVFRTAEALPLFTDDACAIPPGQAFALEECTPGFEVLEVTLPPRATDLAS